MNYYNDNDPYCGAWLESLIVEGLIPYGVVDKRSIKDVDAADIRGFTQCHFFAGVGGWPYALALGGWEEDRPVWTGSCPCQPFSSAGQRQGFSDDRHLWPEWLRLIREHNPPVIFGEQVAGAIRQGWLDTVADDLEGEGYAIGAAVLPACSVGAPHERSRLWFVAHADRQGKYASPVNAEVAVAPESLADPTGARLLPGQFVAGEPLWNEARRQELERLGYPLAYSYRAGLPERDWDAGNDGPDFCAPAGEDTLETSSWHDPEWGTCADGKVRPIEPGLSPMADGVPSRVAKLRAFGNAIVPQVAAAFVRSSRG